MRYVIADIEASGLDRERQMIELALITYQDDRVIDVYETLLNPLIPVSREILNFTGISQKQLDLAPKFYEVADQVIERLQGAVFVSHKVEFDWGRLQSASEQMGKTLKCKTLCTLQLSQELLPGLKSYTLEELCRFFNIKTRERHRALPDAKAALALFRELKSLASTPRAQVLPRFLPQHAPQLNRLPRAAGVLYCKDVQGVVFQIEATEDLWSRGQELFQVRPENRELLQRCETMEFEATGSELIAQFKRARFSPMQWRWMITVEVDRVGEKYFHLRPFKGHESCWYFSERPQAEAFLKQLKARLPQEKFAWREGGKTKQEIIEHNRVIETLAQEAKYPCDNLLLWGPGRTRDEWSYVLVRGGRLYGWGHDARSPDEVLLNPEKVIRKKSDPNWEALTVRYLREHREKRIKRDQWRELKELSC